MSGRSPSGEDRRLWALIAADVRPLPGKRRPPIPAPPPAPGVVAPAPAAPAKRARAAIAASAPPPPAALPPRRRRRILNRRERLHRVIDLHGHDQDGARALLTAQVLRAHEAGERLILVITGKGRGGDGILRRRAPEWLSQPPLRAVIAALDPAHFRHGGEGALYVALKRRS